MDITLKIDGLTRRDLIAAIAMGAIIGKRPLEECLATGPDESDRMVARGAVDYADVLIEELDR